MPRIVSAIGRMASVLPVPVPATIPNPRPAAASARISPPCSRSSSVSRWRCIASSIVSHAARVGAMTMTRPVAGSAATNASWSGGRYLSRTRRTPVSGRVAGSASLRAASPGRRRGRAWGGCVVGRTAGVGAAWLRAAAGEWVDGGFAAGTGGAGGAGGGGAIAGVTLCAAFCGAGSRAAGCGADALTAGWSPYTTCAFAGRRRTAVAQSVGAGCRSAGTPSIQIRHIPAGGR